MAGNIFGEVFKLVSFGESHGPAYGGVIEGCPAGHAIDFDHIDKQIDRRKTGKGVHASARKEDDRVEFLSGIFEGKTLGTPIAFIIRNKDSRPQDYEQLKDLYRPSHADYTWQKKYGIRDHRGSGRASARETIVRVVAGAIANQILAKSGIEILAYVNKIGSVALPENFDPAHVKNYMGSALACPDAETEEKMQKDIEIAKELGNTLGGEITCIVRNCPAGLGEPVFLKFHAVLASAMMGINAVKGFEIGSGFKASGMTGEEHNDLFTVSDNKTIKTLTNYSGGVQGGITNGSDIVCKLAFKPVSTIFKNQKTINKDGEEVNYTPEGRHDVTVVPRAVPIVEAMASIVTLDFWLMQNLYKA